MLTHLFLIGTSFGSCWIFFKFFFLRFFFYFFCKTQAPVVLKKSNWFCHESGPDSSNEASPPEQNWWEVASDVTVTLCWMPQGWGLLLPSPRAVPWPAFLTPGNASVCPASTTGLCKWWFAELEQPQGL